MARSFAPSVFSQQTALTYDVYPVAITDNTLDGAAWVVPAAQKCLLAHRPQRGTLSITIATVAASIIEWPNNGTGAAPATAGTVAVNYLTGSVWFHADDVGKAVSATYKHLGTVLDAGWFNAIQAMLIDVNSHEHLQISFPGYPSVDASAPFASGLVVSRGMSTRNAVRVSVSADGVGSADTVLHVTTAATATGGVDVTLPAASREATAVIDLDVDTSSGVAWLRAYCTACGGHQNLNIGVVFDA